MNWLKKFFKRKNNKVCDITFKPTIFFKPERTVKRIFIHCSASEGKNHDDISVIRQWHLDRGWSNVGYHYFIKKDGTIQMGRDLDTIPAAQKGHNNETIAICLHGLGKSKFTEAQKQSLVNLCTEINRSYDKITFHGHKEVNDNKTCPVIDYVAILGLNPKGIMKGKQND